MNKFLTVDSVGEIDDIDVDEDLFNDSETHDPEDENDAEGGERMPVGAQFVKKVEAFHCEICRLYSPINASTEESFVKKHCLTRSHLKAFIRHKDEEEKAQAAKEEEEEKNEGDEKEKTKDNDESVNETKNTDEEEHGEDKLWEDVDKDLGDLLREVEPNENDEDEEDESVLNIDIERY